MTAPHNLGTLRSLLAQPASTELFEEIMCAIDFFDPAHVHTVHYLERALASWPTDILRPAPDIAFIAYDTHELAHFLKLCNTLAMEEIFLDDTTLHRLSKESMLSQIHTITHLFHLEEHQCLTLLTSPHLSGLHTLTEPAQLYPRTVFQALSSHTLYFKLCTLKMNGVCLRDEDIKALCELPALCASLKTLHLAFCQLSSTAITTLALAHTPTLRRLDLRHNHLDDDAIHALATTKSLSRLEWLDLHILPQTQALRLAESTTLPPIVRRFWRTQCTH